MYSNEWKMRRIVAFVYTHAAFSSIAVHTKRQRSDQLLQLTVNTTLIVITHRVGKNAASARGAAVAAAGGRRAACMCAAQRRCDGVGSKAGGKFV